MKRMSRLVLGLTGIAVIWLLITFSMYIQHEKSGDEGREAAEQTSNGVEHDQTGSENLRNEDSAQIRILTQQEQELYEELTKKEDLDQGEGAILDLLNQKYAWIADGFLDTRECIKQKLDRETDVTGIIGWKVKPIDSGTCLVSFTYEKQGKTYGWFFDIKSGGDIVTDVSSDQDLMEKYHVVHTDAFQEKVREEEMIKTNLTKLEQFRRIQGKKNREKLLEQEKRVLMLGRD